MRALVLALLFGDPCSLSLCARSLFCVERLGLVRHRLQLVVVARRERVALGAEGGHVLLQQGRVLLFLLGAALDVVDVALGGSDARLVLLVQGVNGGAPRSTLGLGGLQVGGQRVAFRALLRRQTLHARQVRLLLRHLHRRDLEVELGVQRRGGGVHLLTRTDPKNNTHSERRESATSK